MDGKAGRGTAYCGGLTFPKNKLKIKTSLKTREKKEGLPVDFKKIFERLSRGTLPYQIPDRFCFVCFLKNERNRKNQRNVRGFLFQDFSTETIPVAVCGLIVSFKNGAKKVIALCKNHHPQKGIWSGESRRTIEDFYTDKEGFKQTIKNKKCEMEVGDMVLVEDLSTLDPSMCS